MRNYQQSAAEIFFSRRFTPYHFPVSSINIPDRDNVGRIKQKTETANGITTTYAYDYDEIGRLLTATKDGVLTEEYQYNENGSRVYEMNAARGIAGRSLDYSNEDQITCSPPVMRCMTMIWTVF